MRTRNWAYRGTLEDDGSLKWKFYNEWCFWALHWYRLIALRFCAIVPVGNALPGDVWLRYWFELMTHGLNNFQQTDGLLIWGLRFLPSSTTPEFINQFLQFSQGAPHYLFLSPPLPFDRDWGSAWHGFTNLGRKKKAAKYTAASCVSIIV